MSKDYEGNKTISQTFKKSNNSKENSVAAINNPLRPIKKLNCASFVFQYSSKKSNIVAWKEKNKPKNWALSRKCIFE